MNDLRFSDRQLRDLLLPLVVEQTLVMLVGMADTVMVSKLGDAAVSGVSLVDQICNVIIALLAALATGGAVVASQMIGANRRDDACRVSNQLVLVVSGVALAIMVPVLAFRQQLLSLMFQQVEPDVMSNALTYLEITAISYPFIAIYNAGTALYRSMNRSNTTMKVSMLVNVINIGGNALFVYGLGSGVEGVAIPTLVSRMTGAVCMMLLLRDRHLQLHLTPGAWKPNLQMMKHILGIGIPNGLEKQPVPARETPGRRRYYRIRHRSDHGERGCERDGFYRRAARAGDESGDHYGSRSVRRRRRLQAGAVLHQKTAALGVYRHVDGKYPAAFAFEGDPADLQGIRRCAESRLDSDHDA